MNKKLVDFQDIFMYNQNDLKIYERRYYTMAKKRYVQVGVGGRAQFYYNAVASTYSETSEIVAFCDTN